MSCTVGGVTPFPPMWAYGLAANQAFRKSKMSCGEIVPEPLKSAWQQGVVWLPAELHAAAFAANRAPIPDAGGTQTVCAMLVEHVDPRQQTPDGGQVLLGAHAVFGLLNQSWWAVLFGAAFALMFLSTHKRETDDHLLIKQQWPTFWDFLVAPPRHKS